MMKYFIGMAVTLLLSTPVLAAGERKKLLSHR
ncbi:Uncharacterised protein [Klebsiella variicola]|jgi:hypothetical protein|nr:Uncharacterised protein [Klebsiella variicola]VUK99330.1 Uncharacterised protein [Klebsiella variicola]